MQKLILTAGEPAGIGPDLCVQIAQQDLPYSLTVIADRDLIASRAKQLGLPIQLIEVETEANAKASKATTHQAGSLRILHTPLAQPAEPGKLNAANAQYVLTTLKTAIDQCCTGQFDALVTAPVHKGIINDAGIAFTGHTEYLAQQTRSKVVMMLVGGGMRVSLVTTHLPLKDVAAAITPVVLEEKIRIIHQDLIGRFLIDHPCIAVTGLNPHAGESGHMGREEIDVIIPVIEKLKSAGINLIGPVPADTVFNPSQLKNYDCVLAMFHDQGLPVLKHASFGAGVNVTLGLPIIRTSVDHGTALDLAATDKVDAGSMLTAIELAATLAQHKAVQSGS